MSSACLLQPSGSAVSPRLFALHPGANTITPGLRVGSVLFLPDRHIATKFLILLRRIEPMGRRPECEAQWETDQSPWAEIQHQPTSHQRLWSLAMRGLKGILNDKASAV